jgi:hypothetical protein
MPTPQEMDQIASEILNGSNNQPTSYSNNRMQELDAIAQEISSSQPQAFQSNSQTTGSFGQQQYNIDSPEDNGHATFGERLYLGAFADDKGKEKFFKDKGYQIVTRDEKGNLYYGNTAKDLRPFDPEGLMNDVLGETADLMAQIPQIGASIIGGSAGAAGGPLGAIAGAGAASGVAELGMKGIGKSLGLNTQDKYEVGTDVAISVIAGSAGEGLGQFLKAVSTREVAKKSFKLLEKQIAKDSFAPEKAKSAKFIAKLFNVTSGVPEEKTLNVFKYGADNVFEKGAGSPERLLNIVDEFSNNVSIQEKNLGKALGASERQLLKHAKDYKVPTADLQKSVMKSLNELGLIDENGLLTTKPISGSSEQGALVRTFEKLNQGAREVSPGRPTFDEAGNLLRQDKIPVLSINPNAEISTKELLSIRNQLQSVKDASKSNNFQRILGDILHGNEDAGFRGIADEVSKIASKVGDSSYMAHRKTFANYKSILDNLTTMGLNPKMNKLSVENITKGSTEMAQVLRREMSKLDSFNGSQFLKKMDIWDTAQAFTSTNPNFLRFNTVAGLLGGGALVGGRSPEEKALGMAGALTLGTPAGIKLLLKSANVGSRGVARSGVRGGIRSLDQSIKPSIGKLVSNKATSQSLSQLAKSKVTNKNSNSNNN